MRRLIQRVTHRGASSGQSFVELALVLPVLLLLTLAALDLGRVYLGWVNVQNMARIAANFAANNPLAWQGGGDAEVQQRYQRIVLNDARAINCDLLPSGPTDTVPAPTFPDGTDLGDRTVVSITCEFALITPIIGGIVGNVVSVGASAVFPVKSGGVTDIPGGGTSSDVPISDFTGGPLSGLAPLTVQFTDLSQNAPATWFWTFGDGGSSSQQSPTHTYDAPGTYTVSLFVTNAAGSDTEIKSGYVIVDPAPGTGPVPEFAGSPTSGTAPLTVQFTDLSTGSPTAWAWDFNSDGTVDSTAQNPTHTYQSVNTYSVTLTVSNASGTNSQTKSDYISVGVAQCVVPNVSDGTTRKNEATTLLQNRGFVVDPVGGPGNWRVRVQSPQGGLSVACGSTVQIFE